MLLVPEAQNMSETLGVIHIIAG